MKRILEVTVATTALAIGALIVMDSTSALLRVLFAYVWLILLPGLIWVWPLKEDTITTFVLANLAGFAFGFVYFLLDMAGIALTQWTFAVVPSLITVAGVVRIAYERKTSVKSDEPDPAR
jgi:hypothetical protein